MTAPAPQPKPQILHLQPKLDPVPGLIKQVEDEYAKGEANYRAGHLEAAREDFDRAFDTLLSSVRSRFTPMIAWSASLRRLLKA